MSTKTIAELDDAETRIVICGGGIVGAAIAYYLCQRGEKPIIVERLEVANAASGKAGGFLAGGWGDDSVTEQLHRTSFDMHTTLAEELGIESYRKIQALSATGGLRQDADINMLSKFTWLDRNIGKIAMLDPDTAQVAPRELTEKLVAAAKAKGADVIIGQVNGMEFDDNNEDEEERTVKAVMIDSKPLPCKKVVVAMGPWSCIAEDWFNTPIPMEGVKSTSLIFNKQDKTHPSLITEPAALFCAGDSNDCHLEVYPRPNGEVYICGIGGNDYLNAKAIKELSPAEVQPNPDRVGAAEASFGDLCSMGDSKVDVAQACLRPCPPDALPMLGPMPKCSNAFLAAGHNCWGILWAPVTGLAMTELMMDGQSKCVDLKPFDPSRFVAKDKLVRRKRRGRHIKNNEVGEQW